MEKSRVYSRVILCGGPGQFVGGSSAINMSTAIVIVKNDEGFGLASDSFHCAEGSGDVLNQDVQKIFAIPSTKLAYALCGTTQLIGIREPDIRNVLFDFADQVPQALERLTQANEPTLWHFADKLGADILEGLTRTIETHLPNPLPALTHVTLVGYYGSAPDCLAIEFTVSTAPGKPQYRIMNCGLVRDVPTGCGSKIIFGGLQSHESDPLFAQYRPSVSFGLIGIDRAVEIAKNAVRAHYDPAIRELDPEMCVAIGGKIRTAKITPADGFSPVPEIGASG